MLATWRANGDATIVLPSVDAWYFTVLYTLGGVHIFLSTLTAICYFLENPPSFLHLIAEEEEFEPLEFTAEVFDDADSEDVKKVKKEKEKESIWARFMKVPLSLLTVVRFLDLYYLAFLALSIAGLFTSGYTYCLHLLHYIVGDEILHRVLEAVTKNGRSLILMLALEFIVIYIFTLAGFAFYRAYYSIDSFMYCDTLWECVVSSVNEGLRNGGGLGSAIPTPGNSFSQVGSKLVFDLLFFIFVSVVGKNVVFGIIVDTFSELRDEKFQIEEDMANNCFICNFQSFDFERNAQGFQHHIKKEHNMWGYLLYSIHVRDKNPVEYTVFEAYVATLMAKGEISWFPMSRSLSLSGVEQTLSDDLSEIWEILNSIVTRFQQEDSEMEENTRREKLKMWKEEMIKQRGPDDAIPKESKESKESKEGKEGKEGKKGEESKEGQESQESQESQPRTRGLAQRVVSFDGSGALQREASKRRKR